MTVGKPLKARNCSVCNGSFTPYKTTEKACSFPCALAWGQLQTAKKAQAAERKATKADRKEMRERKAKLETVSDWVKKCQREFNHYIRARDWGRPCVTCGKEPATFTNGEGWKVGGDFDCGHYLTVGGYPELRFIEMNAHSQCKSCNGGSHYYARKKVSVSEAYREAMLKMYGEHLAWLEGPHEPKQYRIDELKMMTTEFRKRWKELEKGREL